MPSLAQLRAVAENTSLRLVRRLTQNVYMMVWADRVEMAQLHVAAIDLERASHGPPGAVWELARRIVGLKAEWKSAQARPVSMFLNAAQVPSTPPPDPVASRKLLKRLGDIAGVIYALLVLGGLLLVRCDR